MVRLRARRNLLETGCGGRRRPLSQASAWASSSGDTWTMRIREDRSTASRKPTAAPWPARRRRNVHVSPRTWLVVTTELSAWMVRATAKARCRRAC
jgi:hypothetical protein